MTICFELNVSVYFEFNSCNDVNVRKEYVTLVEKIRDVGGEVKIFSSMHISGQRKLIAIFFVLFRNPFLIIGLSSELAQLSGIAAILRFPMPELEEESENAEDNDTDDSDSDS